MDNVDIYIATYHPLSMGNPSKFEWLALCYQEGSNYKVRKAVTPNIASAILEGLTLKNNVTVINGFPEGVIIPERSKPEALPDNKLEQILEGLSVTIKPKEP